MIIGVSAAPRSTELTARLIAIGADQYGAVSRRQLIDAGIPEGAVDRRRESLGLLPVCSGVYAVGREISADEGIWMAAVFAGGQGSYLAGQSAAALWGFMRWQGSVEIVRSESRSPTRLSLLRPGVSTPVRVKVRRSRHLGFVDTGIRQRIPVTSVGRTLLDLASTLDDRRLSAAFNEADRLGLLEQTQLHELADRVGAWKGIGRFRRLVEARQPETTATRSELEVMFLDLCRDVSLPMPAVNQTVCGIEVDCSWLDSRLIVELDGYEFHAGRMAFVRDGRRTNLLRKAGFQVLRFNYDEVKNEPDEVVDLVRNELRKRRRG